jgi:hypothetical protein
MVIAHRITIKDGMLHSTEGRVEITVAHNTVGPAPHLAEEAWEAVLSGMLRKFPQGKLTIEVEDAVIAERLNLEVT